MGWGRPLDLRHLTREGLGHPGRGAPGGVSGSALMPPGSEATSGRETQDVSERGRCRLVHRDLHCLSTLSLEPTALILTLAEHLRGAGRRPAPRSVSSRWPWPGTAVLPPPKVAALPVDDFGSFFASGRWGDTSRRAHEQEDHHHGEHRRDTLGFLASS